MAKQAPVLPRHTIQEQRVLTALKYILDTEYVVPRNPACRFDGKLQRFSPHSGAGELFCLVENKDRRKESIEAQLRQGTVFVDTDKVDALVPLSKKWQGWFKETRVYLTQTDGDKALAIRLSTNGVRVDREQGLEWRQEKKLVPAFDGGKKVLKRLYAIPLEYVEFEFDLPDLSLPSAPFFGPGK